MTWTLDSSGSQTAVLTTEHILQAAATTNATYVFSVRLNNMAAGDLVELRVYTQTLAAGALELAWKYSVGPQAPLYISVASPPVASNISIKVTLKQTTGTGRVYDWKLLRI